ncbi:hypothetical protein C8J57DRAFT_1228242 [Mycena rebaudengoi]|nr:hypothetical protein C8J57DRAFT_1228242 [Mycena rebaudengoi]
MTPGGDFFSLQGKVNFDRMATWWSTQADGKKIFYKLKEHLKSHHKVWEGLRRSQDSLLSSREQRRPSRRRIQAATHVSHVLPAAARDNPGVIPAEDLISESMPDQLPPVNTNLSGSQGADDGSTQMQIPMEVDFLDIVSHPSDPLPDANYRGSTPMPYNTQPWHGIGQTLEFRPTYWPQQALASGSSQMNFVSYTGPPNPGTKQQRKCQNCVAAGESGYNCRGESGRKRCKLLPKMPFRKINLFAKASDVSAEDFQRAFLEVLNLVKNVPIMKRNVLRLDIALSRNDANNLVPSLNLPPGAPTSFDAIMIVEFESEEKWEEVHADAEFIKARDSTNFDAKIGRMERIIYLEIVTVMQKE